MSEWTEWRQVEGFEFTDIIYEKRYRTQGGGVARLLMNRPHRMNAMTGNGWQELVEATRDANRDNTIGVIVLSHVGQHFGVGGDMEWEAQGGLRRHIPPFGPAIKACLKPVIAAVRGDCIGGHNHMAYTCDFTIAGESAIFGQNGPRVASPTSGNLVANSAHNTVVQDDLVDAEVEKWCDELLDLTPVCLAAVKQSFEAVDMPLQYSGNFLGMIEPNFHERPEVKEAQRAFFERRRPNFWTEEMIAGRKV